MSKNMSWAGFIPKWFSLRLEVFNLVGFPSSVERRLGPLSLARVGARKACAKHAPKEQKTLLLRLLSPLVFPVKPYGAVIAGIIMESLPEYRAVFSARIQKQSTFPVYPSSPSLHHQASQGTMRPLFYGAEYGEAHE
jgi:hypothetical protein